MNQPLRLILAAAGIAALGATALPLLRVWQQPEPVFVPTGPAVAVSPSEIVVDLRDDTSASDRRDLASRLGLTLIPNSVEAKDDQVFRVKVPAGRFAALLDSLRRDRRVEAAEPEIRYRIPEIESVPVVEPRTIVRYAVRTVMHSASEMNRVELFSSDGGESWSVSLPSPRALVGAGAAAGDPDFARGLGTRPNDPRYDEQWNFQMIGAEEAWKRTRGKGVVVAVIDTGVSGTDYKKGKACRDFNTTTLTKGYDFVHDDDQPFDDHAHGTHVAGTIAESTNNNEGVAGLAFEASIMPLKVLGADGSGTAADIADAIRWAADQGAHVINMSLGSSMPSQVIHNACKYAHKKGVVIVCAAGNSFGGPVGYPAAFPECIAVSAVGPSGNIAKYSSYGKQVALAAPGGDMVDSGDPADGILQNTLMQGRDDYFAFNGTSMASPHVAAAAALVIAQGVTDPARVKEVLTKTASPKNDKNKYGAGLLNLGSATKVASGQTGPKLRHLLLPFLGAVLLLFGGRRRHVGLRAAMAASLGLGLFGPDLVAARVGADSAWNLLSFSALIPAALVALSWRGPAVKAAGALALGIAVNLFANWHNGTLPFTTATFGDAPLPWTAANLVAAFGLANLAGWRALQRMR